MNHASVGGLPRRRVVRVGGLTALTTTAVLARASVAFDLVLWAVALTELFAVRRVDAVELVEVGFGQVIEVDIGVDRCPLGLDDLACRGDAGHHQRRQ